VLELSSVTAFNVTQGWIRVNDAKITQVLQRNQVFALVESIEPSATERKCAKVPVDDRQQLLRLIHPETTIQTQSTVHNKQPRCLC